MPKKPFTKEQKIAAFWKKIQRGDSALCWPWTGMINASTGKPMWMLNGHHVQPKRVAWRLMTKEPLLKTTWLSLQCRNELCCNPGHMIPLITPFDRTQFARSCRLSFLAK
jgi:hypothetical protein